MSDYFINTICTNDKTKNAITTDVSIVTVIRTPLRW